MLCKRCKIVMRTGTTYDQKKDGRFSARRYHECKNCHDRIYTKELNFQEYVNKALEKYRNK